MVTVLALLTATGCESSRYGEFAPVSSDRGYLTLWKTLRNPENKALGDRAGTDVLVFRPDGRHLASTSSGSYHVEVRNVDRSWEYWGVSRQRSIAFPHGSVRYSPDGEWLILSEPKPLGHIDEPYRSRLVLRTTGNYDVYRLPHSHRRVRVNFLDPAVIEFHPTEPWLLAGPVDPSLVEGDHETVGEPRPEYHLLGTDDWKLVRTVPAPFGAVAGALSPTGEAFADVYVDPGGEGYADPEEGYDLRLWDGRTMEIRHVIDRAHKAAITSLAFTADGRYLVTAGWAGLTNYEADVRGVPREKRFPHRIEPVRVWDVALGRLAQVFRGHRDTIQKLVVVGDLVVAEERAIDSLHRRLLVWRLGQRQPVDVLELPELPELGTIASNDTRRLLAVGVGDEIWLYRVTAPGDQV